MNKYNIKKKKISFLQLNLLTSVLRIILFSKATELLKIKWGPWTEIHLTFRCYFSIYLNWFSILNVDKNVNRCK